jgi:hypothetical protein
MVELQYITVVKSFITLAHGGKLIYNVIYPKILTLKRVDIVINYCGIL